MKDKKMVWANAMALTAAVLWVVDNLLVVLFPRVSMVFFRWWMHGARVEKLMPFRVGAEAFLFGGISMVIVAWFVGFVLGWSLEYFECRK